MWISLSDLSELGRVEQDNEVLLDALKKADLGWKDVWMIAMKLDVYGTGKIRLNELTETMLRSKSGIHGLDISATRNGFRRLCNKSRALDYQVEDIGMALKGVLRKLTETGDVVHERLKLRDGLKARRNELCYRLGINDVTPFENGADLGGALMMLRLMHKGGENVDKEHAKRSDPNQPAGDGGEMIATVGRGGAIQYVAKEVRVEKQEDEDDRWI